MSDDTPTLPPPPDHVVGGGAPDPVTATAPTAPRPPDEPQDTDVDAELVDERPAVYPVAGPQAGALPPPTMPGVGS